ncbi:DUF1579 domain-containing protein [Lysobacter sp. TY2-98]|uniref:DUF1579 family protein n=1 Tax=Lysobacter sp. TY2-98 TaxID=2290922 RepID=UPI000E1FF32D|nr:DUF1579 family protein [Lysobacter sp. TY2-98]AXK72816.1 DUF1579 domain-containing protein [Lysobacter sp. TY2-98]
MKTLHVAVLTLVLAAGTHAIAAANVSSPLPDAIAQDDGHRQLAEFAGLWTVRQSLWLDAGKPPQIDPGTALFTPVLGGRQLQQDLRVSSREPFQALGYIGYDPRTHIYVTIWMDLHLANPLLMRGRYDVADRTYRFSGETTFDDGQTVPTREEFHRIDADHFIVRYFETRGGREALVVELAYSRR